jgi:hypothetical protein
MDLFLDEPEVLLHDFAADRDYTDEIAWLRHVLAVEKVSGPFYLLYEESIPRPALWVRVILSSEFEWVEPLWNLGNGLYFLPTDVGYFLEVMLEEGIPRVFRRGRRP